MIILINSFSPARLESEDSLCAFVCVSQKARWRPQMPRRRPASDAVSASPAKLPKPEVEGEELSNATIRQELIRLGQTPGPVDDGNRLAT